MKLAGRKITPGNVVSKLAELMSLMPRFTIFKNPTHALRVYLTKKNAPKYLELANGFRIYLSSHPEDVVTVAVVFCKHDYGTDFKGKTIIDIGANIGAFSLYATYKEARQVVAIEPGLEAFDTLKRSVEANSLQGIVTTLQAAVTARDGDTLLFATTSSPNNKAESELANTAPVATISLKSIIQEHFTGAVDLLKIDCEGGEYEILYHTDTETLNRIREIRMELHGATSEKQALLIYLQEKGFRLDKYRHDNAWLTNTKI